VGAHVNVRVFGWEDGGVEPFSGWMGAWVVCWWLRESILPRSLIGVAYVCVCVCVCVCVYICFFVCVYVCVPRQQDWS